MSDFLISPPGFHLLAVKDNTVSPMWWNHSWFLQLDDLRKLHVIVEPWEKTIGNNVAFESVLPSTMYNNKDSYCVSALQHDCLCVCSGLGTLPLWQHEFRLFINVLKIKRFIPTYYSLRMDRNDGCVGWLLKWSVLSTYSYRPTSVIVWWSVYGIIYVMIKNSCNASEVPEMTIQFYLVD